MALTDSSFGSAFTARPEAPSTNAPEPGPVPVGPLRWLEELPRLHQEAWRNVQLSRFLARTPVAASIVMACGAVALLASGGILKADFTWSVLVLIGVVAMTRSYIRGFARSLRRVPLHEAAEDLRVLLLYTGAAWGSGAFLILPPLPGPLTATAFALIPSLGVTLALQDAPGGTAFTLPAVFLTAGAFLLTIGPAGLPVAAAIAVAGMAIAALPLIEARRAARFPRV